MPDMFDLHFAAMDAEGAGVAGLPPTMALELTEHGGVRWRVGDGNAAVRIHISSLHSPFVSVWVWAVAIAHRLLPVTLRIDEEGCYTDLCAEDNGGGLRLTLRQTNAFGEVYRSLHWREARLGWLQRVGATFGGFLGGAFNGSEWHGGPAFWPDPGQFLPWEWPHAQGLYASAHESDWPVPALHAWFYLSLARRFDPFVLRTAWCPEDQEAFARLRYLFALRRRKALEGACAALGEQLPPSLAAALDGQFAAARDLFEELEIQRELGIFDRAIEDYVRPELADARSRERLLHQMAFGFEAAVHDLAHGTALQLLPQLPLVPGAWLIDEQARPGRILVVEGVRRVVDWGEIGISTEHGFYSGWRWPIAAPGGFVFPDEPLFRRWRLFATAPQTAGYTVCPCCGYPTLEEEPEEILDCPVCGWPLYLLSRHPLPNPDAPLFDDARGDHEVWPTLRESRRYFTVHGDAFSPDDAARAEWLRRDDISALRCKLAAQFDTWLADPARDASPLPEDEWQRLAWMSRE